MKTYKIVRFYQQDFRQETIETGLSLEDAQSWTDSPETSSATATSSAAAAHTAEYGPWFDGYHEEDE